LADGARASATRSRLHLTPPAGVTVHPAASRAWDTAWTGRQTARTLSLAVGLPRLTIGGTLRRREAPLARAAAAPVQLRAWGVAIRRMATSKRPICRQTGAGISILGVGTIDATGTADESDDIPGARRPPKPLNSSPAVHLRDKKGVTGCAPPTRQPLRVSSRLSCPASRLAQRRAAVPHDGPPRPPARAQRRLQSDVSYPSAPVASHR